MPWQTPTLSEVRSLVRDAIRGSLPGADASVPNSVLRVMSDAQGALCFLTLEYLDWLALQLMPDTAEAEWLDRFGNIWLTNSDGSTGRKLATLSTGTAAFTGQAGAVVPAGTLLGAGGVSVGMVQYQTLSDAQITLDGVPTPAPLRALQPGTIGNQVPGAILTLTNPPPNVDGVATVIQLNTGTDTETDNELRMRVLARIRQPPMGGAAYDYEHWALAVPGVTRAWCSPMEMGVGTCTLRFMMDDLRADNNGFPLPADCATVAAYIDTVRPVTVKQMYVLAPIPQPIDFDIVNLNPDTPAAHAAVETSIQQMLYYYATPGQMIYAAWKYAAVMAAPGIISFDMANKSDDVMPDVGHMAVLGNLYFSTAIATPAELQQQPLKMLPAPHHGRPTRPPNGR